ncbi:MAG: O-antigen ligase family protein [candidate division WOR-3 bacterium]
MLFIFTLLGVSRISSLLLILPLYLCGIFLILYRPEVVLIILVIFTSTFFTMDALPQPVSFGEIGLYLPEFLVVLLFARILIVGAKKKDFRKLSSPLTYPIILFFLWILFEILNAVLTKRATLLEANLIARSYIFYLNFFLALYYLDSEAKLSLFLNALIVVGIICALLSFLQYLAGPKTKIIPSFYWAVGPVSFEDENSLARVMPTSISLIYMFFFPLLVLTINSKKGRNYLYSIAVLAFLLAFFVTFSRNVYYSVITGFSLVWFIFRGRLKSRFVKNTLGLTLLVLVISYLPAYLGIIPVANWWDQVFLRHSEFLTAGAQTETLAWRSIESETILREISKSPFLGQGIGTSYYHPLYNSNVAIAHNGYFSLIYQTGIIGFLLFCLIIYQYIKLSIQVYKTAVSPEHKSIVLGQLIGFIALLPAVWVKPVFVQEFYWISLISIFWALPVLYERLK